MDWLFNGGTQAAEQLDVKPGKAELLQAIKIIHQEVGKELAKLQPAALDEPVESQHPLAKTKREVLSWCTHHQLWHNGIISLLKRMLIGKSF